MSDPKASFIHQLIFHLPTPTSRYFAIRSRPYQISPQCLSASVPQCLGASLTDEHASDSREREGWMEGARVRERE